VTARKYGPSAGPDPRPNLVVERGPSDKGVGSWVPTQKHRLLWEYLYATRNAWKKWPSHVFIDPFAGPGRIQVEGEKTTREGGAVVAWRALADTAPFSQMLVGDLDPDRAHACAERLKAIGKPASPFVGPADETIKSMVASIPSRSLCMAYIDPYNLELLSFSIIEELAKLKVDLAINFSTMDLQRNLELEFDLRPPPDEGAVDAYESSRRHGPPEDWLSPYRVPAPSYAAETTQLPRVKTSSSRDRPPRLFAEPSNARAEGAAPREWR
jgi:three-Cys-motif partner protein